MAAATARAPMPEGQLAAAVGGRYAPDRVTGAPLEVRHLESGGDALLFFFNHDKQIASSTVWFSRPPGDFTAFNLASGRREPIEQVPDGVRLGVELVPGVVQVVRITRR